MPVDTDTKFDGGADGASEIADEDMAPAVDGCADPAPADGDTDADSSEDLPESTRRRPVNWSRVVAYGVLPGLALLLAVAGGLFKFQDSSVRASQAAAAESVQAAKDGTVSLLSYQSDTVDKQLEAAEALLTGEFRDSYTSLTKDVVIPGAKQKQISAVATVPAASSVSADSTSAVVLVFVNQTVTIGASAPTDTASAVLVKLERDGGRWLISAFDPV